MAGRFVRATAIAPEIDIPVPGHRLAIGNLLDASLQQWRDSSWNRIKALIGCIISFWEYTIALLLHYIGSRPRGCLADFRPTASPTTTHDHNPGRWLGFMKRDQ